MCSVHHLSCHYRSSISEWPFSFLKLEIPTPRVEEGGEHFCALWDQPTTFSVFFPLWPLLTWLARSSTVIAQWPPLLMKVPSVTQPADLFFFFFWNSFQQGLKKKISMRFSWDPLQTGSSSLVYFPLSPAAWYIVKLSSPDSDSQTLSIFSLWKKGWGVFHPVRLSWTRVASALWEEFSHPCWQLTWGSKRQHNPPYRGLALRKIPSFSTKSRGQGLMASLTPFCSSGGCWPQRTQNQDLEGSGRFSSAVNHPWGRSHVTMPMGTVSQRRCEKGGIVKSTRKPWQRSSSPLSPHCSLQTPLGDILPTCGQWQRNHMLYLAPFRGVLGGRTPWAFRSSNKGVHCAVWSMVVSTCHQGPGLGRPNTQQ